MTMTTKASDRWFVRCLHLFLTGIVMLLVFLKDTELKQSLFNGQLMYVALYLTLVTIATVLYYITSFMDPGYVLYSSIDVESGVVFNSKGDKLEILPSANDVEVCETSSMLEQDAKTLRQRRCGFCEIIQPLRTKHCEECKHCVRRYDHHCPWIGSCVGERNHKFFLSFLAAETLVISWTVYVVVRAFHREREWKDWIEHNWMYLAATVFLAVSLLVVGLLWVCHTYMMFTAQTTWEFMSRPRISYLKKFPNDYNPFDRGYIRNMLSFLCYFRIQHWDDMYED